MKLVKSKLETQPDRAGRDAPIDGQDDVEGRKIRFDTELATLRQEHMAYLERQKVQYEKQVLAYKASSNTASQEWHNIEHELANERAAHLDTVKAFRECREKLTQHEIESNERVSELLLELEAARKMTALVGTYIYVT